MIQGVLKVAAGAGLLWMTAACEERPARPQTGALNPPVARPASSDAITSEQVRSWAVSDRAAFLAGRVVAADRLYRAGETQAALAQISSVTQIVASADNGALQALGFQPARVEALVAALELDRPAEEIAPLFIEAESSLSAAIAASGAAPEDVAAFLMQLSADAYGGGVRYGEILDAGAYQSSYGYAVAARDLIAPLDPGVYGDLGLELDILVLMWLAAGPLPDRTPPPEVRMAEQFARVKLALAMLP
ncbi:MAG: hypothetical protein ACK4Y9_05225 [Hyphomonas sp.]